MPLIPLLHFHTLIVVVGAFDPASGCGDPQTMAVVDAHSDGSGVDAQAMAVDAHENGSGCDAQGPMAVVANDQGKPNFQ